MTSLNPSPSKSPTRLTTHPVVIAEPEPKIVYPLTLANPDWTFISLNTSCDRPYRTYAAPFGENVLAAMTTSSTPSPLTSVPPPTTAPKVPVPVIINPAVPAAYVNRSTAANAVELVCPNRMYALFDPVPMTTSSQPSLLKSPAPLTQ
jgi:hypothetical protein